MVASQSKTNGCDSLPDSIYKTSNVTSQIIIATFKLDRNKVKVIKNTFVPNSALVKILNPECTEQDEIRSKCYISILTQLEGPALITTYNWISYLNKAQGGTHTEAVWRHSLVTMT